MAFLKDLIRWFVSGSVEEKSTADNPTPPVPTEKAPPKKKANAAPFDFMKETDPQALLCDLHSLKPFTEQFNRAREELLNELQRLAPPKRYRGTRKNAA